jgi:hypothetical protein
MNLYFDQRRTSAKFTLVCLVLFWLSIILNFAICDNPKKEGADETDLMGSTCGKYIMHIALIPPVIAILLNLTLLIFVCKGYTGVIFSEEPIQNVQPVEPEQSHIINTSGYQPVPQ